MLGSTLNHYKILSCLGKGGMGEVYLAEDTRLGRKVALKVLPAKAASDPERRARFEREARAVAALNHPNIVTIHSVEQAGDVQFITMEVVEGRALTELIPKGGVSIGKLLDYAATLAEAVTAAHKQGITHRDLKPDNIMLSDDGRLKVLDFGLAKLSDDGAELTENETSAPTKDVTQQGRIMGTVAYMSPEQSEGKPADARSDVFSLGILIYQMATGVRPFQGDTPISILSAILKDTPPSVTDVNQDLPRHLGRIVKRCLHKDPERRYQTAQDLWNDLEGLREEIESGELQPTPARAGAGGPAAPARPGKGIMAVLVVSLAAILAGVWYFGTGRLGTTASSTPGESTQILPLTSTGTARGGSISRDGRYVVYVERVAGKSSLWVTQVSTRERIELIPPSEKELAAPVYSPNGEFIYYLEERAQEGGRDLYRIAALGGRPRRITETAGRVSFSPDGGEIVFSRRDRETQGHRLLIRNLEDGSERVLLKSEPGESLISPIWSPDGAAVAAWSLRVEETATMSIISTPVAGGEIRTVVSGDWITIGSLCWSHDGEAILFVAGGRESHNRNQIWEVGYPVGPLRQITSDLNIYTGIGGVTADGTLMVADQSQDHFDIWIAAWRGDETHGKITSESRGRVGYYGLDWAPDGRVVYAAPTGQGGNGIWIMEDDGSGPLLLSPPEDWTEMPRVTSDGRHVVFFLARELALNLWRMNLDGSDPVRVTQGGLDYGHSLSPDDKWIVYSDDPFTGNRLARVSVEGGETSPVYEKRSQWPEVSPDGLQIALRAWSPDESRFRWEIIPFEGGDIVRALEIELPGDPTRVQWSPDGKALTYVKEEGGIGNIWSQPIGGGPPEQLTHFDNGRIAGFSWSPDGNRIALSRGRSLRDLILISNFR